MDKSITIDPKKGSTWFLRIVIFIIGLIALALCIFSVPRLGRGIVVEYPMLTDWQYNVMIGLYTAAVPFFFALYKGLTVLSYIDKDKAFSESSVKALRAIKHSAFTMSIALYVTILPFLFNVAEIEDAPGLVIIGSIVTSIPLVIAVAAAVLERLLKNAIAIQSENDLTV